MSPMPVFQVAKGMSAPRSNPRSKTLPSLRGYSHHIVVLLVEPTELTMVLLTDRDPSKVLSRFDWFIEMYQGITGIYTRVGNWEAKSY
ncbi:hypothetical protein BU16DRAFT_16364 [Lophium mytilinum]|uniref:Uncharacterized protein n=1 Tax=Lophium mytilinum TaxID=390894 RepID=A0A6A6RGS7_9PEZI|nr:hypothetical protein BU16DRAFT_16364 [Lophium mytilinum]